MKTALFLLILFGTSFCNAQYLQNDTIYFDFPNDTLARLWDSHDYNHTDIDLKNKKIINDFYVFEDEIVFAADDSLQYEIGSYHKNMLYLNQTYKLSKPLFNRLQLTETESKKSARIRTLNDRLIFDDPQHILTDIIKLWLAEKSIRRLLHREEAEGFIEDVLYNAASSF